MENLDLRAEATECVRSLRVQYNGANDEYLRLQVGICASNIISTSDEAGCSYRPKEIAGRDDDGWRDG